VHHTEVYDEVERSLNVSEISLQLDVSTPLTPAPGHLLCLYLGQPGCVKQISDLLNHPIMVLLGTRMSSARVDMITKVIKGKLFVSTCRGRQCGDDGDLHTHNNGEEKTFFFPEPNSVMSCPARPY
jgi:hypothetical protein